MIAFDRELREVSGEAGVVRLSHQQAVVLGLLLKQPGRLVYRETLMVVLHGDALDPPHEKSLDLVMHRLRERLRPIGLARHIEVVRGDGWVWRGPAAAAA